MYVHRVAFLVKHGRWPMPCALHKCDTPACVNPDHIFEGTKADNNFDKETKGRARHARGMRVHCSKLTPEQVFDIRARIAAGETYEEVARLHGIAVSSAWAVVTRKSWGWL